MSVCFDGDREEEGLLKLYDTLSNLAAKQAILNILFISHLEHQFILHIRRTSQNELEKRNVHK